MRVHLITLTGGGDTDRFLLPTEVFEWFQGIEPGAFIFPIFIQEALKPFLDPDTDSSETLADTHEASMGSCDNDVALLLSVMCRRYDSTKDVLAACQANGWVLSGDEYEGCIY